jgi:hypothetical protein
MKTKTLFIALLATLGGALAANAQITTGEPTSKVIRTGNRAEKGDFGLYIGATTSMFGNIFKEEVDMVPLPLLNLKYMATDKWELRIGVELYRSMEKLSGSVDNGKHTVTNYKNHFKEGSAMLYPGFAYHFSPLNIFDVYLGAELPFGWNSFSLISDGTTPSYMTTKKTFNIGLGAFVGIQAFIANLPLAIGLEYGFSSHLNAALKYKNVVANNGTTQVTYSPDLEYFNVIAEEVPTAYDKLRAKAGGIGSQIRVTLSYYFK